VQGGGIVFGKPDDVAALAAAMRELVHSAEERKRMGEAARRAASEMDWATTADGYLKVYADLNESQDRDSKSARS
jgi:glycosyltransferase involved in cell wall biosynthesis